MQISIKTNFPEVQKALGEMQKDIARTAAASALNKVVAQAKTAMAREIRSEFVIASDKVNGALSVTRASARGPESRMQASLQALRKGRRSGLNLINFIERSTTLAQAKKRRKAGTLNMLYTQIKRSGGRKALGPAFIGNKGRTVFVRVGKERLPIKALTTVDVASMFNTRRINAKVLQLIDTKFPAIFANEARFFTERFNAKR
jgi:hypothetical protein